MGSFNLIQGNLGILNKLGIMVGVWIWCAHRMVMIMRFSSCHVGWESNMWSLCKGVHIKVGVYLVVKKIS